MYIAHTHLFEHFHQHFKTTIYSSPSKLTNFFDKPNILSFSNVRTEKQKFVFFGEYNEPPKLPLVFLLFLFLLFFHRFCLSLLSCDHVSSSMWNFQEMATKFKKWLNNIQWKQKRIKTKRLYG